MKKTARNETERTRDTPQPELSLALHELVRRDLREFVVSAGMAALAGVLEQERAAVCGPRYEHDPDRAAHRAGHTWGQLTLGGRRTRVRRPRARGVNGREVVLPTWQAYSSEDPLHDRALKQMLLGVSTRRYAGSLEDVPDGTPTSGTSRSAVSRRFVAATQKQMGMWLGRDLTEVDLAVLMIDGVHVDEHVLLVASAVESALET